MSKSYTFEAIFNRPEVTVEASSYDEAREQAEKQLHNDYRSFRCPEILEVRDVQ